MSIAPEFVGFLIGYCGAMATFLVVYTLNTKWPLKKKATPDHKRKEEES